MFVHNLNPDATCFIPGASELAPGPVVLSAVNLDPLAPTFTPGSAVHVVKSAGDLLQNDGVHGPIDADIVEEGPANEPNVVVSVVQGSISPDVLTPAPYVEPTDILELSCTSQVYVSAIGSLGTAVAEPVASTIVIYPYFRTFCIILKMAKA